jgi:hypothetical protein
MREARLELEGLEGSKILQVPSPDQVVLVRNQNCLSSFSERLEEDHGLDLNVSAEKTFRQLFISHSLKHAKGYRGRSM